MLVGEAIREISNPESGCCGGDEGCAVVGLEAPLGTNRDDLVAIHELPGFGATRLGSDRSGCRANGSDHAACRRQRHCVPLGAAAAQHACTAQRRMI